MRGFTGKKAFEPALVSQSLDSYLIREKCFWGISSWEIRVYQIVCEFEGLF